MAGRNFLFVPGPTNVPDRVLRAMHRAMEDHRSSDFPALAAPVLETLKKIFKTTSGQAFIFPSSGTGAWEASLSNTLSPGDKVLASRFGMFSHLWIDMAQRLGLQVDVLDAEWGEGAPIERYQEALAADKGHGIKAVLFTHNETATGVTSDVAAIRRALNDVRHPALLMVDGVSSIGSIDFRMDEWGVDLAITGSQKGLMLPAGLGIVCASQKALALQDTARLPRVFFDFSDMRKANATGYFPYTPSLPLLYGLRESLAILMEEGLENVFARHHRLAEGTRLAIKAWGLELCARSPKWYSDTVSAIMVPSGVNGAEVIDIAYRRYNLALGAGLARMAGRLFRIGHLGDMNELMLMGAIAGSEMAMRDVGIKVTPGSGVAAAGEYWRSTAAPLPKRELPPRAADAPAAQASGSKEKVTAGAGR
jgi:alanine-glyoxylate transaminase/serine-glyoxylate transaminase/serine-pyruvate transaminase